MTSNTIFDYNGHIRNVQDCISHGLDLLMQFDEEDDNIEVLSDEEDDSTESEGLNS